MSIIMLVMLLALSVPTAKNMDYHETLCDHCETSTWPVEELKKMFDCVNDKGPCTDLFASYRQHYPHILVEACARCTAVQKHSIRVFFERARKELPKEFEYFLNLHDPQRKYFDSFYNAYKDF